MRNSTKRIPLDPEENYKRLLSILQHWRQLIKEKTRILESKIETKKRIEKEPDEDIEEESRNIMLRLYEHDIFNLSQHIKTLKRKCDWIERDRLRFVEKEIARKKNLTHRPFENLSEG